MAKFAGNPHDIEISVQTGNPVILYQNHPYGIGKASSNKSRTLWFLDLVRLNENGEWIRGGILHGVPLNQLGMTFQNWFETHFDEDKHVVKGSPKDATPVLVQRVDPKQNPQPQSANKDFVDTIFGPAQAKMTQVAEGQFEWHIAVQTDTEPKFVESIEAIFRDKSLWVKGCIEGQPFEAPARDFGPDYHKVIGKLWQEQQAQKKKAQSKEAAPTGKVLTDTPWGKACVMSTPTANEKVLRIAVDASPNPGFQFVDNIRPVMIDGVLGFEGTLNGQTHQALADVLPRFKPVIVGLWREEQKKVLRAETLVHLLLPPTVPWLDLRRIASNNWGVKTFKVVEGKNVGKKRSEIEDEILKIHAERQNTKASQPKAKVSKAVEAQPTTVKPIRVYAEIEGVGKAYTEAKRGDNGEFEVELFVQVDCKGEFQPATVSKVWFVNNKVWFKASVAGKEFDALSVLFGLIYEDYHGAMRQDQMTIQENWKKQVTPDPEKVHESRKGKKIQEEEWVGSEVRVDPAEVRLPTRRQTREEKNKKSKQRREEYERDAGAWL